MSQFEFRPGAGGIQPPRLLCLAARKEARDALALYFAFYNFCRIHKTLRMSPAMAAGITDRLWSVEDIVAKTDAMAPAPKPRGPYKKRGLTMFEFWKFQLLLVLIAAVAFTRWRFSARSRTVQLTAGLVAFSVIGCAALVVELIALIIASTQGWITPL